MPTPSWGDAPRWRGLKDGTQCPFCVDGPRDTVATLSASVVTADASVNVKGYCCIVARDHATELHEMDSATACRFMEDVRRVGRLVQEITGAIKLNYEIHGNVVPHVHMHIIPRYPGDAIERTGEPFARLDVSPFGEGEFEAFRERLTRALTA
jgi:diadenosine tetraphosphate (Ap4A) HIT family hydrolase